MTLDASKIQSTLTTDENAIERVRAKITALKPEDRCAPACRTWDIFDTGRGLEIERCDACWHDVTDPLLDDEAALLPEAQAALAAQSVGEVDDAPARS
jgi:hypothetical protein